MWVELVVNPHLAPGLFLWVLWFSNLTTIDNQLRLMWTEFVVGPHLALRLFLQVLRFSNFTVIDHQLRLMWIEFVVGPHLVLRLFNSSGSLVFQFDHNRSPAKTDVASSLSIVTYLYHQIPAWVVQKVDNTCISWTVIYAAGRQFIQPLSNQCQQVNTHSEVPFCFKFVIICFYTVNILLCTLAFSLSF